MSLPDAGKRGKKQVARSYAPLLAVAAAVILIMAGVYFIEPGLGIFRHDDPSQAKSGAPSAADLALMYSSIFGSLSGEDFSNATALVEALDRAYVPDSLAYTFARFNSLLLAEISTLNITDSRILDALRQCSFGNTGAAAAGITNATWTLAKANITRADLFSAADELSRQFRMRPLSPELESLLELIERYSQEIAEVNATIEGVESGNLTATKIALTVGARELLTGGSTWAAGALSAANGTALAGMPVLVYAGGSVMEAVTGSDGAFNVTFLVSGYAESITVAAAFLPQAGYVGCISGEETILVNYIKPSVTVALDRGSALPQEPFTVAVTVDMAQWAHGNSSLVLPPAPQGAVVEVSAFGTLHYAYVEVGGGGSGTAYVQLTVPYGAASGAHEVRASVVPLGVAGPGEGASQIAVYRLPTAVSLSAPGWALGGTGITITGSAEANGSAVAGARVTAYAYYPGGSPSAPVETVEAVTDASGTFTLVLPTGALTPSGTVAVDVKVVPDQDQFAKGSASAQPYLLSPAMLAVPVVALGAAGVGLATWSGRRARGGLGAGHPPEGVMAAAGTAMAAGAPRQVPPEGTIAGAYARAATWVGSALGRRIRASETVREYYSRVEPGLGAAREPFRGLTVMLEDAIYGLKEVSVPAARGLLERVKGLLGIGMGMGMDSGGSGKSSGNDDGKMSVSGSGNGSSSTRGSEKGSRSPANN